MASPTPSLESRANSFGSLVSLSPVTVSGSSPPASDSAICDVDSCDNCLDTGKLIDGNCNCHNNNSGRSVGCTGCKSTETGAVARCFDCANFLCPNCVMAHQFMHCFEGHRVLNLGETKMDTTTININTSSSSTISSSSSSSSSSTTSPGGGSGGIITNGGCNIITTATTTTSLSATTTPSPPLTTTGSTTTTIINGEKTIYCPRHKSELLKYFCRTCTVPVCKECTLSDHPNSVHDCIHITEAGPQQLESIRNAISECREKANEIRSAVKTADHGASRLQVQYHKAQNEINTTFHFYRSLLDERKQELLKELESVFSAKQISLSVVTQKSK